MLRRLIKILTIGITALAAIGYFSTVQAVVYPMPAPGNDIVGDIFTINASNGDSLEKIATRYGLSLHEVMEANPQFHTGYLRAGEKVVIPSMFILPKYRKGIVINLAELRLYYFTPDGKYVHTYPVGLGREGWRTPLADTFVVRKKENPEWNVPKSIREFVYEKTGRVLPDKIEPDDPENPLGEYALYLGKSGYLIHGTNQEWSVGKFISSGCIRLYNADIQELFYQVPVGTPVKIVHHPIKAGWYNGKLFMEAQVPMELNAPTSNLNVVSAESVIEQATEGRHALVNWNRVEQTERAHRGIPEYIGQAERHPYYNPTQLSRN